MCMMTAQELWDETMILLLRKVIEVKLKTRLSLSYFIKISHFEDVKSQIRNKKMQVHIPSNICGCLNTHTYTQTRPSLQMVLQWSSQGSWLRV